MGYNPAGLGNTLNTARLFETIKSAPPPPIQRPAGAIEVGAHSRCRATVAAGRRDVEIARLVDGNHFGTERRLGRRSHRLL